MLWQNLKDAVVDDERALLLSLCQGPGRLHPVLQVHLALSPKHVRKRASEFPLGGTLLWGSCTGHVVHDA